MILLENKKTMLVVLLLSILVCIIYAQTGWHDFICFDDGGYIYNNPAIKNGFSIDALTWSFSTFYQYNWHPLTWLSHLADTTLFGLKPAGHHLHSAALHCANAILLFILLARTTGNVGKSFVIAALFAVHPLRVESVAWGAERKDVLSAFFGFSALYTYVIYTENQKLPTYLTALIFYTASLMSKPTLVTLPFLLLLFDSLKLHNPPFSSSTFLTLIRQKIPFFILAAASSIITIIAQYKGGAVATLQSVPLLLRLENAVVSYWRYIYKTIVPKDLSVFYLRDQSLSISVALLATILLLTSTYFLFRYNRQIPLLIFGWLWFILTLLPMSGIIQVGNQAMADRYSYIPTIGLLVVLVWGTGYICDRLNIRPALQMTAAGIIIVMLTIISWQQTALWKTGYSLFNHALKINPENHVVLTLMGDQLREENRFQEAIPFYRKALALSPNMHTAHNNLAICLTRTGNFIEARQHLSLSLMLNPGAPDTLFNLGIVLGKLNLHEEAAATFHRFLQRMPRDAEAYFLLAESVRLAGRPHDAIPHYEAALALQPSFSKAAQRLQDIKNQ